MLEIINGCSCIEGTDTAAELERADFNGPERF